MLGMLDRIDNIWERLKREASGRNAIVDTRLPGGREQGLPCQDQVARSFNGIKSL